MTIEQVARVAHEVNRAYCEAIGDMSQLKWDDAPEWQKESAVDGVIFRLKHPKGKPEDSHIDWLKEKKMDGWVYGEVKDPIKKTHPCILQYEELSLEQRVKDHLFIAIVDSLTEIRITDHR